MGRVKELLEDERERRLENNDFDWLFLFTNEEARPTNSDSVCYFQVYADVDDGYKDDIAIVNVKAVFCDCDECRMFGDELNEYVSVRAGLEWILKKFSSLPIWLWVSSERFLKDSTNFFQDFPVKCEFQFELIEALKELFNKLDIRVDEYSYGNKEMIPVFEFGGVSTERVEV